MNIWFEPNLNGDDTWGNVDGLSRVTIDTTYSANSDAACLYLSSIGYLFECFAGLTTLIERGTNNSERHWKTDDRFPTTK